MMPSTKTACKKREKTGGDLSNFLKWMVPSVVVFVPQLLSDRFSVGFDEMMITHTSKNKKKKKAEEDDVIVRRGFEPEPQRVQSSSMMFDPFGGLSFLLPHVGIVQQPRPALFLARTRSQYFRPCEHTLPPFGYIDQNNSCEKTSHFSTVNFFLMTRAQPPLCALLPPPAICNSAPRLLAFKVRHLQ
jgi:hypothetical protein